MPDMNFQGPAWYPTLYSWMSGLSQGPALHGSIHRWGERGWEENPGKELLASYF